MKTKKERIELLQCLTKTRLSEIRRTFKKKWKTNALTPQEFSCFNEKWWCTGKVGCWELISCFKLIFFIWFKRCYNSVCLSELWEAKCIKPWKNLILLVNAEKCYKWANSYFLFLLPKILAKLTTWCFTYYLDILYVIPIFILRFYESSYLGNKYPGKCFK